GGGPLLEQMRHRAGPTVQVMGWQSDDVVRDHFRRCRALLFCGLEDFGIVPVEAQAAGRPVIAFGQGGAAETIEADCTGLFFSEQTAESVADAIVRFESHASLWSPQQIQKHTERFSTENFRRRFQAFYDWCVEQRREGRNDGDNGVSRIRQAMKTLDPMRFH
ncbi:MAG: glycosyltransferase, partial [Phycisphaerae bacterium]|nr:glycosyltransferase [Phycisphaerae bacterium]